MKKIISIILVAVLMSAAVFTVASNAMDEGLFNFSADWYAYAGAFLSQAGHCDELVKNNMPQYDRHADPNADIVGFYGWAALKEGKIKTFGVKLDNGAMIDSPLARIQNAGLDRTAELEAAGIVNGEAYWTVFYYNELAVGKHNAAFYAIGEDDKAYEIFNYDFMVVERDPDQWLCDPSGGASTGWWMHPFADQAWEFTATFTTPYSFNCFCALFYANGDEGATVNISLLDENGNELETQQYTQIGDSSPTLNFSKAYPAGTYTFRITSTDKGAHFVMGSGAPGELEVTIGGNCNTNDNTMGAPCMFLVGASKAAEAPIEDPTEDPGTTEPTQPSNPDTADASVIAIVAVACVALAGVAVAKKFR